MSFEKWSQMYMPVLLLLPTCEHDATKMLRGGFDGALRQLLTCCGFISHWGYVSRGVAWRVGCSDKSSRQVGLRRV